MLRHQVRVLERHVKVVPERRSRPSRGRWRTASSPLVAAGADGVHRGGRARWRAGRCRRCAGAPLRARSPSSTSAPAASSTAPLSARLGQPSGAERAFAGTDGTQPTLEANSPWLGLICAATPLPPVDGYGAHAVRYENRTRGLLEVIHGRFAGPPTGNENEAPPCDVGPNWRVESPFGSGTRGPREPTSVP